MSYGYGVQISSVPADRAEADALPLSQVVLEHRRTEGIWIDAQPLTGGQLLLASRGSTPIAILS
jgi:hypothetical protein